MEERKKVIKIVIEREDEIKTLEGEEADRCWKAIEDMSVNLSIRRMNPFDLWQPSWKVEKK